MRQLRVESETPAKGQVVQKPADIFNLTFCISDS